MKDWKYMLLSICVKYEWNNLEYNFRDISSLFLGRTYYFILHLCYFLMLCHLWLSRWKTERWKMDTGSSNQRLDDFSILLLVFRRIGSVYFIIYPTHTFEHLLLHYLCWCFLTAFSSFHNFCLHVSPICLHLSTTRFWKCSKFNFKKEMPGLEVFSNFDHSIIEYSIPFRGATNTLSTLIKRTNV